MNTTTDPLELLKDPVQGLDVRFPVQEVPDGDVTDVQLFGDVCVGLPCGTHTDSSSSSVFVELAPGTIPFLETAGANYSPNFRLTVLEGFPSKDELDSHVANADIGGDLLARFPCGVPAMNSGNISFGDFSGGHGVALHLGSVTHPILAVFFRSSPTQVFEVVVAGVAVEMSALQPRGAWSYESHENELMNPVGSAATIFGQFDVNVPLIVLPQFQELSFDDPESIPFANQSGQGLYPTPGGNSVRSNEVRNIGPTFGHVLPLNSYRYKPPYRDFKERRFVVKGVRCA